MDCIGVGLSLIVGISVIVGNDSLLIGGGHQFNKLVYELSLDEFDSLFLSVNSIIRGLLILLIGGKRSLSLKLYESWSSYLILVL